MRGWRCAEEIIESLCRNNKKLQLESKVYELRANELEAKLKDAETDIERRKNYESYLQSTTDPMHSYNTWKRQIEKKGK